MTSTDYIPRHASSRRSLFDRLINPDIRPVQPNVTSNITRRPQRDDATPRSLTAAATRLTRKHISDIPSKNTGVMKDWQVEAWELFRQVGEQRFLATVLAGTVAKAKLFVGKLPEGDLAGSYPSPVDDDDIQDYLSRIGNGPAGRAQFLSRLAVNLIVAGEAWVVGIPPHLYPGTPEYNARQSLLDTPNSALIPSQALDGEIDVNTLIWRAVSLKEVTIEEGGNKVSIGIPENSQEKVVGSVDDLFLIRVWQQDPLESWEADSPTRSVLPVLRELVGLTMHVSAQVDSRLAGAGLLIVPQSVHDSIRSRQTAYNELEGDDDEEVDVFMESLIEAMTTPIKDRSSAAAVVPLTVTVPDEATGKFQHIQFSTPLDDKAKDLRDESIRRLALGQDAPPELLLGTGSMNHWGAWAVQEDTISTHVEPYLALICDALTEQYLRPVLLASGMSEDEVNEYAVWYDVSHLIPRPNRARDAAALFSAGVISEQAYREAAGFDETHEPGYDPEGGSAEEEKTTRQQALEMALEMVGRAPSLMETVGLGALVEQIEALMEGEDAPNVAQPVEGEDMPAGGIPDTDQDDAPIEENP